MPTIDITTTQKVTIEYELAALRDRIIANLMDQLILIVGLLVISLLLYGAFGEFVILLLIIPIYVFYTPVSEILLDGQTLGKRIVGIKVVKLTGSEPSNMDYLIRWVFRMVDVYLSAGIISAMLVSSSPKAQRLGGIASNTILIKVKFNARFRLSDIEKISSLENYEPQYVEVKRLNEEDMLLIKSVITRVTRYNNLAHQQLLQELVDNLTHQLELNTKPRNNVEFLKTLIRDYIVLTR